MATYKNLTDDQIKTLTDQGCSALDWKNIQVADGFNPVRARNTHFSGNVKIGSLSGNVAGVHGIEKTSGIYNANIHNCTIGDNSRIANVGVHIANYNIGSNVCIENVGTIQTNPNATFGNGTEVEVLNEGGGREVILFDQLSVQYAYMTCLYRYRPQLTANLNKIALDYVETVRSDQGTIADGAKISTATEIIDVNVGPAAVINAASSLVNGTILSAPDASTLIGPKVVAKDFIIAESAEVTDGAVLAHTFVGQGAQMGKQYSAENSLFFANCEAFHGEACSIFAGPYTVTHHKSTLLIAGLFSFYNAGSGTNQSNHMYKLGPVHEGKLARGTKTGSFSYMMWPCSVGPFGVVLGKHTSTFNTSEYPFSHHEARADGKCTMIPGLNLTTVGTVRDGAKWPNRDRRKGKIKRDLISFDVFSPYTVGKMIRASESLKKIYDNTDKSIEEVSVGGALVRRPILRTGQKFYRAGIHMYLTEKVFSHIEKAVEAGDISHAFANAPTAVYSQDWVDVGGQLMPHDRLFNAFEALEKAANLEECTKILNDIHAAYADDEWVWIKHAYKDVFGTDLDNATKQDIANVADEYLKARGKFLRLVVGDAEKEFDELSHSGFGQDGSPQDIDKDFTEVRGTYQDNKFVKEMQQKLADLEKTVAEFKTKLEKL
ncbi:MAG: DUF4954 family protein [Sedimentisphaerales bacterium]|nr:DUF4954 family protein [Sedimentisphaerales bacterium]